MNNNQPYQEKVSRRLYMLLGIIAVSFIGSLIFVYSRAAGPFIGIEPDTGTVTSPAVEVTDGTASGGAAIKFGQPWPGSCPIGMAHRGYWAGGKTENSIGAYTAAYDLGMPWAEGDIWFTSDGHAVMMHDSTVDATTTGTGTISSKTLAQFKALTMNDGQKAPSFADTLDLIRGRPDRKFIVELKDTPTTAERTALLAQLQGLESQVYVNAFSARLSSIQAMKTANPLLDVSLLGSDFVFPVPSGISGENIEYTQVTASEVARLHADGLDARTYTPSGVTNWRTLKAANIDAIITNDTPGYLNWVAGGCQ